MIRIPQFERSAKINFKLRSLIVIVIILCNSIPCFAQHSIKGRVIDEDGKPLTYATIVLLNPVDSTMQYYDVADDEGYYKIDNIKSGTYLIQYSFVSKEAICEEVTIPSDSGEDFGDKIMAGELKGEDVVVIAEYVPIEIKQDTVAFNAKAFKTKPGAVVEDLLRKIPGIEVDKAGNMKALGEDVEKVLVDGKEFFDKDPKVATKNLPAKAIDKVQVFDKKSEEAEFMGIDDGVRDRTINLLLNEDSKKGYFGNEEAGGGTGEHYRIEGKLYRFSSKLQSALFGMYNNINEFGYTGKDSKYWGEQVSGLNTTTAGGINLSYNVSKYNRYFFSYLVSSTKQNLEQDKSTENFIKDESYFQIEDLDKEERNTPHKANFGVRHKFNSRHNLMIDGDINISSNNRIDQVMTNTSLNDSLINNLDNTTNSKSFLSNFNLKGVDIVKLNGDKTQIKTSISAVYNKNNSELDWTDTTTIFNPASLTVNNQYQDNITDNLHFSVNPTLVQKIKPLWYLSTSINGGVNNKTLNRNQGIDRQDETFTDSLSADFNTDEIFIRPSFSLRRSTSKSQFNISVGARWNQFDKVLNDSSIDKSDYLYLMPGFSYNSNYRAGRYLHLRYNSSVNMPAVNQLLPVINTINQLSLYQGNIDLKPEYRHNLSLSWTIFDHFSFTSLFARLGAGYTKDKISLSRTINEDFTQLITPVNVPDHYTAYSYIYFSTPIRSLGIKVNIASHENWSRGISVINSEDNIQNTFIHTLDLNFENRRKEKWDITLGGSVSVTDTKYSISESQNNLYFNTTYYTDIGFTPNEKWNFETEANVVNYNSKSFSESVSIPILNAGISHYFLKGKKASLTLYGYDLLNENKGFQRISETNYLIQREWNTIGRYVMLSFSLRIGGELGKKMRRK